jgi:predicted ferric reductase/Ca2+-binding EF-hand superfamily protein
MPTPPSQHHKPGAMTLDALERRFEQIAGDRPHIEVSALKTALGLKSDYLAARMLGALDTNGDGVVSREEFLEGVRALVYGTDRDRLKFAFRLHDHDGDGYLSLEELERMIAIGLAEDELEADATQPPEVLALALLRAADRDGDGRVSFAELESMVQERPALLREMARAEALWMAPNRDLLARISATPQAPAQASRWMRFLENQWIPAGFVVLLAVANLALFLTTLLANPDGEHTHRLTQLGRAAGAAMSFDAALILLPVMRRLLTRVRASWVGRVVPVDSAVGFHKLIGHALIVLTIIHVTAFAVSWLVGHPAESLGRLFFLTERGLSGTLVFAVFAVMWVAALRWIRRSRRFEVFYFTHLLYAPWVVLLIVHAPRVLLWLGLPLLGFGIERILRLVRRARRAEIISLEPLRSGVTRLEVARPPGFTFAATDYVFARIPTIARHEWHPFTISSAPERDTLTLHVRTLGNWTSAVRTLAETRQKQRDDSPLAIYLDGPYGSPSTRIFGSRFAVLIGAGIGVTPFASVLESIVSREQGDEPVALEKAHFFWLNQDLRSFEWFRDLLREVERRDTRGLLELHLHMTSGRTGATAFGVEMARELAHAHGLGDVATGLRAKTRMSAPDWRAELKAIARAHAPHPVDVYFCGPHGLGVKLKRTCAELGMPFREEKF